MNAVGTQQQNKLPVQEVRTPADEVALELSLL